MNWRHVLHIGVFGIILLPILQLLCNAIEIPNPDWLTQFAVFDAVSIQRFWNSVQTALWDVLFSAIFAFPVYWVFLHANKIWRVCILVFAVIPFTFPAFTTASSWLILLSRIEQGAVSRVIWGAHGTFSGWLYSIPGCGLILALHDWTVLFLFLVMTTRLTSQQMDACRLYLRRWQLLWYVLIPAWKLPFLCGGGIIFAIALTHFETASLLQIDVYSLEIYTRFSTLLNNNEALVLCIPFLLLSICLAYALIPLTSIISFHTTMNIRLHGVPYTGVVLAFFIAVFTVFIPVSGFFAQTQWHEVIALAWQQYHRILNSLLYSLTGGLMIVVLGLIVTKNVKRFPSWLTALFAFLFFLPGIITAAGVLELRSWLPFVLPRWISILSLIYAHICHFGLIGLLAGKLMWQHYGHAQLEYETVVRIPFCTKLYAVYLPALWKPALLAVAVTALLIWSDVVMTVLLHPPGGDTLTVYYYNQLHYGSDSRTAAAGLLLLTVPLGTAAIIMCLIYGIRLIVKKKNVIPFAK